MVDHNLPRGARVLVTGATGFTGSTLARQLLATGAVVRAIARQSSKLDLLNGLPIEWVRGDVGDPQVVAQAMDKIDYVFHVAAAYREAKASYADNYRVHVESTQHLANAALTNPGFKRFVHVSTVGVHGHIENPPADESWPYSPGDDYQKTKVEGEVFIREFSLEKRLPFTIIRPAAIYGAGDRRLFKLFKMAARPFFPILGNGRALYHLIHVEDLARAMILSATHQQALSEAFICGNRESIELEKIAAIISEYLGRKTKIIRLPAAPFFAIGAACEAICKPVGIEPPIHRRRVAFFTKDRSFSTTKIRERLGFEALYSNERGLVETVNWYLKHGWLTVSSRAAIEPTPV